MTKGGVMKEKFTFSVVIPIYNTGDYLRKTLDSVVKQTVGFVDNIQLILVNDGSTDSSGAICKEYHDRYPRNIVYVNQANAGVSAARNAGIEHIEGRYVNFFDSDDLWTEDVFAGVKDFIHKNADIGIVALPVRFIEAKSGEHPLNYKFTRERIVDIDKEPWNILSCVSNTFIRRDLLDGLSFDSELKSGEDALFSLQCVLRSGVYGLVCRSNSYYCYRKRETMNSATNCNVRRRDYFFVTLDKLYDCVIRESIEKRNEVHPYIQYLLLYEMSYRIRTAQESTCLSDEEWSAYSRRLQSYFKYIDNSVIIGSRFWWPDHKLYALHCKYGDKMAQWFSSDKNGVRFGRVYNIANKLNLSLVLKVFDVDRGTMTIAGSYSGYYHYIGNVEFILNGKCTSPEVEVLPGSNACVLGEKSRPRLMFKLELPANDFKQFSARIAIPGGNYIHLRLLTSETSHFSSPNNRSYIVEGKAYYHKLYDIVRGRMWGRQRFKNLLCRLRWNWRDGKMKYEICRLLVLMLKLFKRKEVWIFSDRFDKADDNGEFLFRYVLAQKNPKIDAYYMINRSTSDFKRISKYGKVLDPQSYWYRVKFLLADKIISSQFDAVLSNPFILEAGRICDLFRHKFVFLAHGIHKDDISGLLNIATRPVSLLTTTVKGEYNAIRKGRFLYDERNIKLTGMPRYDFLENKPEKLVVIMPTWRRTLSGAIDPKTRERGYNPMFKESSYFCFWQRLISDEKICSKMRELGYRGLFVIHPCHLANAVDFVGNDVFSISKGFADYTNLKSEASLMVTDYSSAVFEYSYLRKPIVYVQADRDEFYGHHTYVPGFFDYSRDGFGPVTESYEETLAAIVNYLESDCRMERKYMDRVDRFFTFKDRNNCSRVYNAIRAL